MKQFFWYGIMILLITSCASDESKIVGNWWLCEEGRIGGDKPLRFSHKEASPVFFNLYSNRAFSITMNVLNSIPAYSGTMSGIWEIDPIQKTLTTIVTDGTLIILDKTIQVVNNQTNYQEFIYTTNATDVFGITNRENYELSDEDTLSIQSTQKAIYDLYKRQ